MLEVWKKIVSYDHDYQISNYGRFRKGDRLVTPCENNGYLRVCLIKNKRSKSTAIHRLVLTAFIGACPDGMIGLHNNDVREDNRLENLRWGSYRDNLEDAKRNGRFRKLADDEIRRVRESSLSDKDAAQKFNMSEMAVFNVRLRVTYRNVV